MCGGFGIFNIDHSYLIVSTFFCKARRAGFYLPALLFLNYVLHKSILFEVFAVPALGLFIIMADIRKLFV